MLLEKKSNIIRIPQNLKPKSIILKGIRGNFNIEDIKQEIVDLNILELEITNLSKFVFDKTHPESYHNLLQVLHNSKTRELFKIKTIAFQRVRWEHLRRPIIFQCRKCQRLGHTSKNCFLQYRCVKCANNHESGRCPISKEDDRTQLKCANCGQEGHPASYKGCPYIKFAMEQKKMVKTAKVQSTLQSINNITASIRSDTSFAQATSGGRHGHPPLYPPKNAPSRTITTQEAEMFPYRDVQPLHQAQQQTATQSSWVVDLKRELAELVSAQFKTLAARAICIQSKKIKMSTNSNNIKQIRVAAINVNSLIANYRRLELVQFSNKYKHDVIFLSETKLNKSYVISLPTYKHSDSVNKYLNHRIRKLQKNKSYIFSVFS